MPPALPEPVLTLSIDNLVKLTSIDMDDLSTIWNVFTKCKDNLENGRRLENISWRLWYRSCHPSPSHHSPVSSTTTLGTKSSSGLTAVAPERGGDPVAYNHQQLIHTINAVELAATSNSSTLLSHTQQPLPPITNAGPHTAPSLPPSNTIVTSHPHVSLNAVSPHALNRLLSGANSDTQQLQLLQQLIEERDPHFHSLSRKAPINSLLPLDPFGATRIATVPAAPVVTGPSVASSAAAALSLPTPSVFSSTGDVASSTTTTPVPPAVDDAPPLASVAARFTLQGCKPAPTATVRPLSSLAQSLAHLPLALRPRFATIQIQQHEEGQRLLHEHQQQLINQEISQQQQQQSDMHTAPLQPHGKATFFISHSEDLSLVSSGSPISADDHNSVKPTTSAPATTTTTPADVCVARPNLIEYRDTAEYHHRVSTNTMFGSVVSPDLYQEYNSKDDFSDDDELDTDSNYSDYDEGAPTPPSFFEKVFIPPPNRSLSMKTLQNRSLLSVALRRSALRKSKPSQFRGLNTLCPEGMSSSKPLDDATFSTGSQPIQCSTSASRHPRDNNSNIGYTRHISPLSSFVQTELTASLRQMLAWDHAMPFNTTLSRQPLPHPSIHPSDFGQECW
ncbi:hypothetical protein BASA50_002064 [Batrachochytrium salamandrivorans]|uniref:Nitrogen regulatory protein areA GATA-like domain-containing protein n=1 Tax=Batrachochytrium salamandrivorans TaxID=1357716 RepID=A0ABQ8FMA4_9FUNG|nr:hypothetical protein BASA50_002064 [Batrachochytrium salamandrivorans]